MIEFDNFRLVVLTIVTILCMIIAIRHLDFKQKYFIAISFIFITLYSGVGAALTEANSEYFVYYLIYVIVLAYVIRSARVGINFSKDSLVFDNFLRKYAKKMIIAFFALKFISFVFPQFKLLNLIAPPAPSLEEFDFTKEGDNYGGGPLASLLYLASNIAMPFFYWGLYYYRKKIRTIVFLVLLDVYMIYCNNGYVGRGTILQALIICFCVVFFSISKRKQRILIISCIGIAPFLLFGFYYYSVIRLGGTFESISISDAIQILFGQEIGYPLHYSSYIKKSGQCITDYIIWLILQPFPGFMKFGLGEFYLNREFSEAMLGLDASDSFFFILLPGVIGEALFVFGPMLYLIHAIILGMVIKFVIKTFGSNECFQYIFYLCIVQFSFMLGRAGTISVYPSMFKSFLILVITCMYIRNKYYRNNVQQKNTIYSQCRS